MFSVSLVSIRLAIILTKEPKMSVINNMLIKLIFNHKSLLLAGIALNVALMIHVYFIVDGGPASMQQGGNLMAVLNEVPMTILFFLASVFKPYLMVWSRCRGNSDIILSAGTVMFSTTAIACLIVSLAGKPVIKDLTLYINWAFLWAASAYFALTPQRTLSSEQ